ncbi:hypothetical protein V5O48_017526 [Marasmius crinis-equi]|uniref:Protein kinase domain-containing protein n=1 Tax=Marasmius crinis-equi TaxID=585013 RepID=A0ABR3ENT1_9AGAR
MEKGDLRHYLKEKARKDVDHQSLAFDVAAGLSYLHSRKIVHGDLKGVDILMTPDERACIGDFGLSRVADSHALRLSTSTSRQKEAQRDGFHPSFCDRLVAQRRVAIYTLMLAFATRRVPNFWLRHNLKQIWQNVKYPPVNPAVLSSIVSLFSRRDIFITEASSPEDNALHHHRRSEHQADTHQPSTPLLESTTPRRESEGLSSDLGLNEAPAGRKPQFLGSHIIPDTISIDPKLTNSLNEYLGKHVLIIANTRSFTNELSAQLTKNITQYQKVPSLATLSQLAAAFGRAGEVGWISYVYRVGQKMVKTMEHDTHIHRLRMLEMGGATSADAYGGLIMYVNVTADDASNAMELYREALHHGVEPNVYLYNNIISKLAKARRADKALELFFELKASQ